MTRLVLATAISGAADYLVTGDKELRALDNVRGVRILALQAMLAMLDEDVAGGG